MKKFLTILLSFLFVTFQSAKAEGIGIGITGAVHMFDASGTETTRESGEKNSGSNSETAAVPELFIEATAENGAAFGLSYIPTRDVGSKSRSDTNSEGDTGTYKATAELDNVVQLYADIPTAISIVGYDVYAKVGIQHATISTLESLNSGSTYPDADVLGFTLGVGTKGDLGVGNLYYKAEATYTKFDDYKSDSSAGNKVEASSDNSLDVVVTSSTVYAGITPCRNITCKGSHSTTR